MDKLLKARLGRCPEPQPSPHGFAAAGAIASAGKLVDISTIYTNVKWEKCAASHSGYMCESVLSTTMPILSACKKYKTIVYMTSRKFSYFEYCARRLFEIRQGDNSLRTYVVVCKNGKGFDINDGSTVTTYPETEARGRIADILTMPLTCAVCDWDGIPLYEALSTQVSIAMWWYPTSIDTPLTSVHPGSSSSYYARAYSDGTGASIVVGAYDKLQEGDRTVSKFLRDRWQAYDTLIQAQPCAGGECFSCSYLRGCVRRFCGVNIDVATVSVDLILSI